MDMNQLLFRHQIALIESRRAVAPGERRSSLDLVAHYAHRIASLRHELGVAQYPLPGQSALPA